MKKELCKNMTTKDLRILGILLLVITMLTPMACTYQDIRVMGISQASDEEAELYNQIALPTVFVQAAGGSGSGVVFDSHLVLTAAHVVSHRSVQVDEDGRPYLGPLEIEETAVLKNNGADVFLATVEVIKLDEELDLAVLKLALAYPYGKATFASADPKLYQKCWVSGHPHGVTDPMITEGRVQDLWIDDHILYSAPSTFGNSGGPVFILEGGKYRVTSIVQMVFVEGFGVAVNHMGLGAMPKVVREFIN